MEVFSNRFPMIMKNILKKLDNITLLSCKESSRELNTFLQNEKLIWLRIVGLYKDNFIGFEKSWKQTLEKNSVDNIKQLALATQKFFKVHKRFSTHWHPLFIAAAEGSLELCKHIIEKTGEKNPSISHQKPSLDGPPTTDLTGYTALHFAAQHGYLDVAKLIIDSKVDIDPLDSWGYPPFYYAAMGDNVAVWELFTNNLEDMNPENSWGWTPCHQAALSGSLKILKSIMDNVRNKNHPITKGRNVGVTPLHIAAETGEVDTCRLIMKYVRNKNPPDVDGITPLHTAAFFGHLEVVKLLLDESDDKNPIDRYGRRPASYAVQNHHYRLSVYIAKYLIKSWIVKRIH